MNFREKLFSGELYNPKEPEILEEQMKYQELLYDLNQLRPFEEEKKKELVKQLFAEFGEGSFIQLPVYANWGCHTYFGKESYANFNLTLVDDGPIHIGDHVMIGPNVTFATAGHPMEPSLRKQKLQFNRAITIGNNVWIGANVSVMPGVTIGENSIIGAGSVVTKDIPKNVLAFGTPCRVIREIMEEEI